MASCPHHSTNSQAQNRDDGGGCCCCCGRAECAFRRENQSALDGLERNLDTAARLGQALLHRHESYMAQAEDDRQRLLSNIDTVERERHDVQAENARVVQANRGLIEQLDALNGTLADSDAQVSSLTVALENTEAELRSVSSAAARAADLEAQLAQMESEQSRLQESLVSVREDEKSAAARWKRAEATLRDLHEQVDRMEREAREEREQHAELVARMERRRSVERELDGAAGRLKGAAAAHELDGSQGQGQGHGTAPPPGTSVVVSRFVRDILQDNASLQVGIIELRDLLENSNQEVQTLRDQIMGHYPDGNGDGEGEGGDEEQQTSSTRPKRLSQELESRVSPEYHIHHHYHPPSINKPKLGRRLSKTRRSTGNHPAMMHSAGGTHFRQLSASSTSTILSQTSVSVPPSSTTTPRRWPAQTATESLASSPNSGYYYRPTSIFDRVERGFEESQPTSPEGSTLSSPVHGGRGKRLDRPFQDDLDRIIADELANLENTVPAIPEEIEDLSVSYMDTNKRPVTPECGTAARHHRRQSHDSLLSVAGMDIHTPTRRPSRMREIGQPGLPIGTRRNISPGSHVTPPVTSTSTVTADREAASIPSQQSPRSLLASMAENALAPAAVRPSRKPSLSRRVGGWVRGRWGTGASAATDSKTKSPAESVSEQSSTSTLTPSPDTPTQTQNRPQPQPQPEQQDAGLDKVKADLAALGFRHPGVNQKGPICGFRPPPRAPVSVQPVVDEGLLMESLAE